MAAEIEVANEPAPPSCRQCRKSIPAGARLCSECGSYQDWRGYISLSSTVLALLIALISVISATGPKLYELIHQRRSVLTSPVVSVHDGKMYVDVTNVGDAAAVFEFAHVHMYFPGREPVHGILVLDTQSASMIDPGSHLLSFTPKLRLGYQDAAALGSALLSDGIKNHDTDRFANIRIDFIQSDGKRVELKQHFSNVAFLDLLDAYQDACRETDRQGKKSECQRMDRFRSDPALSPPPDRAPSTQAKPTGH